MNKLKRDRQFRPLPVPDVDVHGLFGERQDAICDSTAETLLDRCVQAGMLGAIDVDQPSPGIVIPIGPWGGSTQMFWDSDFGKSIETVAYSLYRRANPALEARVDAIIDMYEKLQDKDGYLNAWFQRVQPDRRWTNLRDHHELYCAGHLIEGAVAYYQATGKRKLLDIMCRFADYMISVFGHGPGKIPGYCGHEEVELALVKLARVTGEKRYLDLAKFFIDERGTEPNFFTEEAIRDGRNAADFHQKTYEYGQAHEPVREQKKVVGHAVRAMYLYSGMADIATEYNDDSLTGALETLWDDLTTKQMYVTGGIGPAAANEGFTDYYDLPNESAYAETCASVGLVFWANRMLGRGPNRRYADIMEQALYNGAMAGLSLDGKTFFYENPLESAGKHHRWTAPLPLLPAEHCPPARLDRLLHVWGGGRRDRRSPLRRGKRAVRNCRHQRRAGAEDPLPWHGAVHFDVKTSKPAHFAVSLRIPEWAKGARLAVNGETIDLGSVEVDGYARIEREWRDGDKIDLNIPLEARALWANPLVRQDAGRAALLRGPLVYCVEATDNGAGLNGIRLGEDIAAKTAEIPKLGGAVALDIPVTKDESDWGATLYRTKPPVAEKATVRFVPYHLWDNRAPGEMLVWIRSAT